MSQVRGRVALALLLAATGLTLLAFMMGAVPGNPVTAEAYVVCNYPHHTTHHKRDYNGTLLHSYHFDGAEHSYWSAYNSDYYTVYRDPPCGLGP